MSDIPVWPAKLTRDQKKAANQRSKAYYAALKGGARNAGWRFVQQQLFRQTDGWFINVLSSPLWERGARVRIVVKPMALDPLFWDIVGLGANEKLPLSFRAIGAWVLRPAWTEEMVALNTMDGQQLAADVADWSDRRANAILQTTSLESMLCELPDGPAMFGQRLALAICLHILNGNLDEAMRLCRTKGPDSPTHPEEGGFVTGLEGNTKISFVDQAIAWIERKQGSAIRPT